MTRRTTTREDRKENRCSVIVGNRLAKLRSSSRRRKLLQLAIKNKIK